MRYRYLVDFRRGISVFVIFSYGIAVLVTPPMSPSTVTFESQHGRVVPRDWKATKGLLLLGVKSACQQATIKFLSPSIMSFATSRHNLTDTMTYSNIVMRERKLFFEVLFLLPVSIRYSPLSFTLYYGQLLSPNQSNRSLKGSGGPIRRFCSRAHVLSG